MPRVLVVEDERTIAEAIAARLAAEGFAVELAHDGLTALDRAAGWNPDLVVLDVMLPGLDGLEVCRRLQADRPRPRADAHGSRRRDRPPRGAGHRRGRLHDQAVLDARARRAGHGTASPGRARPLDRRSGTTAVNVGDLRIDGASRRVWSDAEQVHLTPTEFDLSSCLAARPGTVLSRESLLAEVWGWADASGTRTVDSHVKSLRRKLGADLVRTVHGVGYALEAGERTGAEVVRCDLRPLDPVRSIKTKLGLLVAVTIVVGLGARGHRHPARHLAVDHRARRGRCSALAVTQLLARGMTSPMREMTRPRSGWPRATTPSGCTPPRCDEVGELARAFNRMAATSEIGRPAAPGPGGQRVARAADTHLCTAGRAGEPGRRGVEPGPGELAPPWRRPSGWDGWSATCSTCPASRRE